MDQLVTAHPEEGAGPAADTSAALPDVLVRLRDVHVSYPGQRGLFSRQPTEVVAVEGVSLEVERGKTLGIVGGTGAGKSTIAHLVIGMAQPTSGTVEVLGHDLARVRGEQRKLLQRKRQVVLQDPFSSLNPRMRVRDIISEPLTLGGQLPSRAAKARVRDRVAELLDLVGLPADRADAYPHQFSGGQRQRISIARALAPDPELIVLDEPTSALDVSVRAQILNLLKGLQQRLGLTYLVISHDLMTVAYLSSTVAVMRHGRILEMGPTVALYKTPRHPYTVRLLASIPGATGTFLDQSNIALGTGEVFPPAACTYAAPCALRAFLGSPSRCFDEEPTLAAVSAGHSAACHFTHDIGRFIAEEHPALAADDAQTTR